VTSGTAATATGIGAVDPATVAAGTNARPNDATGDGRPVLASAYRPGLDGLRGIAILLVLGWHLRLPGFMDGGLVGVTMFFVLSGYLITGTLLADSALIPFYIRRAARLLPALILVLVTVAATALVTGAWNDVALGLGVSSLYIANFAYAFGWPIEPFGHMWSLATEEQFYLIWPFVVLLAPRRLALIAIGGIAVCAVLRALSAPDNASLWMTLHLPLTRADALMVGCAIRVIPVRRPPAWLTALAALFLMVVVVAGIDAQLSIRFLLLPIAVAAAIVVLREPAWLAFGPLVATGRISYGLYLWHYPLIAALGPIGGILAFPIAFASHRILEEPIRRAARRYTRRRRPA
jgi:peptidoglycan/LPS O-acetylase OafA/YrhL